MDSFLRFSILCTLISAICTSNSFTQTSIGPMIGYEFSTIMTYDNFEHFSINEEPLSIQNPVYGIKIEQRLTNRHYISVQANFSEKKFSVWSSGFFPTDSAVIESYRFSFSYKYQTKNIFLSLGSYVDLLRNNRTYQYESDFIYATIADFEEYGILASVGCEYKNFDIELFNYFGLSQIKEGTFTLNHKPFFSIGASISYLFELNLKGNGKKVMCPKV